MEEIARKEEKEGRKVKIGYGRICIEEHWFWMKIWKWDEEKKVLRNEKGNKKQRRQGENGGRKKEGIE